MSEKANSDYLQYSALLNPFLVTVLDQANIYVRAPVWRDLSDPIRVLNRIRIRGSVVVQ